ncbi:S-formylglutathione hydrolase YeiG [invertebrate metagenome]|uniref:S-formylglutathione hydrolase YeiG n=1 Tax=invertebrate metagenome TaxID=1711999 RepID=A0A2H9T5L1_9ZZZZ
MKLITVSQQKCFDGWLRRYQHRSSVLNCTMYFSLYLPPQAEHDKNIPLLYWLSGLTCTDENFMQKAGALKKASELGLAIVAPDTSPRGKTVPDDPKNSYDFGLGAGFYVNATQAPWNQHYQMYDYIRHELPTLMESHFPVSDKRAISGHSMGGHGALMMALRNPSFYCSATAFSPLCHPIKSPWGIKAFSGYLGNNEGNWKQYDCCELIKNADTKQLAPILIDQGENDEFLNEQLLPQTLIHIAKTKKYPLTLRMQPGYDHSYYFIASFIEEHLWFHHQHLTQQLNPT